MKDTIKYQEAKILKATDCWEKICNLLIDSNTSLLVKDFGGGKKVYIENGALFAEDFVSIIAEYV